MADRADERQQDGVETGPQGTRVFKRDHIDHYFPHHGAASGKTEPVPSGAALIGVNGSFRNRRFEIPTGRSTVGRSSTNNIVVDSDSVSMVHARLLQKGGEWWVLNLLSTNGTYVNHRKVTDSKLRDGDRLHFGDAEFIFHIPTPRPAGLGWLVRLGRKLRSLLHY
ncbi:MAG: FHA domain-containing protein [Gammaproteobacteria bacterium]|nr:FHA domain-containing protein [Gammaproteobacteria bacterium]